MIKSRLGLMLAAAAVVFALSPEARKAARKLAVKGAGVLLGITDQIKDVTAGLQSESKGNEKEIENPVL